MPFILVVSVLAFILDQVTKSWVRTVFSEGFSRPILKDVFHLTFVRNTGSAFGLFPGRGNVFILFSILAIIILLVIIYRKRNDFSPLVKFSFGLLLGGVSGNLADRLRFGAVVDFLDFRIWPVFNVADSCITFGVILLSFHLLRSLSASDTF